MASSISYLVNRMNGTCGCSPVYNDSRFHIYCNVWKKQNPITEIAQFSEWPPHPTQFEVRWCYSLLIIYQKTKKTRKQLPSIWRQILSPIRWAERFYKIGQTYLGKQLGSNYFSTLFKTTNGNVCQLSTDWGLFFISNIMMSF